MISCATQIWCPNASSREEKLPLADYSIPGLALRDFSDGRTSGKRSRYADVEGGAEDVGGAGRSIRFMVSAVFYSRPVAGLLKVTVQRLGDHFWAICLPATRPGHHQGERERPSPTTLADELCVDGICRRPYDERTTLRRAPHAASMPANWPKQHRCAQRLRRPRGNDPRERDGLNFDFPAARRPGPATPLRVVTPGLRRAPGGIHRAGITATTAAARWWPVQPRRIEFSMVPNKTWPGAPALETSGGIDW